MSNENASLLIPVLCLLLFIIAAINFSLFITIRNNSIRQQLELVKKAAKSVSQPWSNEDKNLEELSKQVMALKEEEDTKSRESKE